MPASQHSDVTLAVLAGGRGARMGFAKGNIEVRGEPILTFLDRRIAWPGPRWVVTAPGRERPPGWERFDRELTDDVAGLGPLRGILTALEHLRTERLIVTTVDMPNVRREQLGWMLEQLELRPEVLGVMCRVGERVEPFPLALRRSAREVIKARLASGRRSVARLLEEDRFECVTPPGEWDGDTWLNLNEPADLERIC